MSYGEIKSDTFNVVWLDSTERQVIVTLLEEGAASNPGDFNLITDEILVVRGDRGAGVAEPIAATQLQIEYADPNSTLSNTLSGKDPRKFKLRVSIDGGVEFEGYLSYADRQYEHFWGVNIQPLRFSHFHVLRDSDLIDAALGSAETIKAILEAIISDLNVGLDGWKVLGTAFRPVGLAESDNWADRMRLRSINLLDEDGSGANLLTTLDHISEMFGCTSFIEDNRLILANRYTRAASDDIRSTTGSSGTASSNTVETDLGIELSRSEGNIIGVTQTTKYENGASRVVMKLPIDPRPSVLITSIFGSVTTVGSTIQELADNFVYIGDKVSFRLEGILRGDGNLVSTTTEFNWQYAEIKIRDSSGNDLRWLNNSGNWVDSQYIFDQNVLWIEDNPAGNTNYNETFDDVDIPSLSGGFELVIIAHHDFTNIISGTPSDHAEENDVTEMSATPELIASVSEERGRTVTPSNDDPLEFTLRISDNTKSRKSLFQIQYYDGSNWVDSDGWYPDQNKHHVELSRTLGRQLRSELETVKVVFPSDTGLKFQSRVRLITDSIDKHFIPVWEKKNLVSGITEMILQEAVTSSTDLVSERLLVREDPNTSETIIEKI